MPEYDPVTKISIVPRGNAGGLTFFAPSEERLESGLYSRCVDSLQARMGGQAAVEAQKAPALCCPSGCCHHLCRHPLLTCSSSCLPFSILLVLACSSYLENQMAVALGGRVAEELIYGPDNVTTGASGDFQQVGVAALANVF